MPDGYGEDLAYIHDVGHGDFARAAAPALLRMLRDAGIRDGLVIDLGCGSGIWARELTGAGFDVLGIDHSAAMLRLARRRASRARFRRASFLDVNLPRCVAVTALGEVFNYLFDARNDRAALRRLFRRVREALPPRGMFIFDVATPNRGGGGGKRQRNLHGPDWDILLETEEDVARRVLTRGIVAFRKVGRLYRTSTESHRLRLYDPRLLACELRTMGFTVHTARSYGDVRLPEGWVVLIARKA